MCLIVVNWRPGHEWPLLVVANRDEFRERPTEPMHWWPTEKSGTTRPILAGRDQKEGGTWLALDNTGRMALLTNIRPGYIGKVAARSRGEVPLKFLRDGQGIQEFHRSLLPELHQYGGFNILLSDNDKLFWFSSDHPEGQWLQPGIHGISNDALNTPWPKMTKARQQMQDKAARMERDFYQATILTDQDQAPDAVLPATGLPRAAERLLSAQTITADSYGTRSRTWIRRHGTGRVEVAEQELIARGLINGVQCFNFDVNDPC